MALSDYCPGKHQIRHDHPSMEEDRPWSSDACPVAARSDRTEMRPERFFISTPFMRWTLVPVLVLFAISTPTLVRSWTVERVLLVAGMSSAALLYAATLIWTRYLRLASRLVAGIVFAFYAAYAVHEWFFAGTRFRLLERPSVASPRNALLGLLVIGMPCLIYAMRGAKDASDSPEFGELDNPSDALRLLSNRGSDLSRPMEIDFYVVVFRNRRQIRW
jgi:hypothetical protein